jgi:hypothetical protein
MVDDIIGLKSSRIEIKGKEKPGFDVNFASLKPH